MFGGVLELTLKFTGDRGYRTGAVGGGVCACDLFYLVHRASGAAGGQGEQSGEEATKTCGLRI